MKAPVYSKTGNKKGELVLAPEIFAARINKRLLELIHKAYAANLRKGTASTKTRKEVRGGGKKPWKQKGTGRARHGSIRSPIWRGGGTTFGPHPRDYYTALPKKMRNQALISALSLKGDQKNLMVLEEVGLSTGKTKEWAEILKALPLQGKRALCVVKEKDTHLDRASQNMQWLVQVEKARDLNAYQVLQRDKIIIEENALPLLEERLMSFAKAKEE
ncbi:MAG: 50S ribosomal protein L4 [Candidatus Omnitrophica bacterium]|nr:50S ribosomal protein L4 [Candidatus Omnitrophota bacterium]